MTSCNPRWQHAGNLKANIGDRQTAFAWHWYLIAGLLTEIWNKTVIPTIKRPFALRVEVSFKTAYYSFKIFSRFWLDKTTCIIHQEFCYIEPMTSKEQPTADYWTDDIKMLSNVQPAADFWTVDQETWGRGCVIFDEQKNKKLMFSFKSLKIIWINNKAIIEFGFCRIWRILQMVDNTLLVLQNFSYPTQPYSIIAKYAMQATHVSFWLLL